VYTYLVDDTPMADGAHVQLVTAWRALFSRPTAGVLAVATPCVPDCDAVQKDLDQALTDTFDAYRQTPNRK